MADAAGEEVRVTLEGFTTDGTRISEVRIRWFGMDNSGANKMQRDTVSALVELVEEWDKVKNPISRR